MNRERTNMLGSIFASRAAAWLAAGSVALAGCGDGHLQTFVEPEDPSGDPQPPAEPGTPTTPGTVPSDVDAPGNESADPPPSFSPDPPSTAAPEPGDIPLELLIDDLEDGDLRLADPQGGYWYSFNDMSGSQTFEVEEPEEDRGGSRYSLHTSGGGFDAGGAGVGVPLGWGAAAAPPLAAPLDARGYDAVAFWARADRGSERRVDVQLQNPDRSGSLPFEQYEAKVTLSGQWERYVVRFEELEPSDGSTHLLGQLDLARLTYLQFFFPYSDDFDIWLDDIAFIVDCRYCDNHLHHATSELPDPPLPDGSPLGH
jgi:hypothetical protein